jgi:hypothetical protein
MVEKSTTSGIGLFAGLSDTLLLTIALALLSDITAGAETPRQRHPGSGRSQGTPQPSEVSYCVVGFLPTIGLGHSFRDILARVADKTFMNHARS